MRVFTTAMALLFFTVSAFAGNPVGKYLVAGKNPGGKGTYAGTVTVVKTGETYKVTWDVGGTIFVGTGVGDENFLAVSYVSGDNTGLALYGDDGENWTGIWTYQKGTALGAESWTRK